MLRPFLVAAFLTADATRTRPAPPVPVRPPHPLTRRENEVLYWVAMGKTNLEIAAILAARPLTVKKHLEHIYEKLDVHGKMQAFGLSSNIAYVLRTANSWAGPIGHFKLTLDKGAPSNVISLCAEGVKKTGPTTFVVEKTDFTPDRDLDILIVQPGQD